MKRRNGSCMWWSTINLLLSLTLVVAGEQEGLGQSGVDLTGLDRKNAIVQSLDELWESEVVLAQMEAERLLRYGDMSVPTSRPTARPTPTSAPQPTTNPPAPTTPAPTTSAESCLDGRTRSQYVLDQLSLVTDPAILQDPTTPQGQAFLFMTGQDPLMPNVCTYNIEQRYSLVTFYYSTTGSNWTLNSDWLGPTTECLWFGVVCDIGNSATNLTLASNNLAGPLPNELGVLSNLTRLELFDNGLTGSLPTGMANMSSLNVLDVEMNQLSGPALLDTTLLALTSLNNLFMSNNDFTGTIPASLSNLVSLESFWVADNRMSGPVPDTMASMTGLTSVIIYGNKFNNLLDQAPFPSLLQLSNLQLQDNDFGGSISSNYYGLTNLQVFRIDTNFVAGTIGTEIGQLTALRDFRISTNLMRTPLPSEIGALTNLQYLVMGNNFIEGTIPDVFALFQDLVTFDVSLASLTGPIPSSLFFSPVLEEIYLNNNLLSGTIPSSFTFPLTMTDLYLNNNNLNGTIPEISSGDLPALSELLLQANRFSGSMPATICELRSANLEDLFADCQGSPPEIICDFPTCCNMCFQSTTLRRRQLQESLYLQRNETLDWLEKWQ